MQIVGISDQPDPKKRTAKRVLYFPEDIEEEEPAVQQPISVNRALRFREEAEDGETEEDRLDCKGRRGGEGRRGVDAREETQLQANLQDKENQPIELQNRAVGRARGIKHKDGKMCPCQKVPKGQNRTGGEPSQEHLLPINHPKEKEGKAGQPARQVFSMGPRQSLINGGDIPSLLLIFLTLVHKYQA